jgi:chitinase
VPSVLDGLVVLEPSGAIVGSLTGITETVARGVAGLPLASTPPTITPPTTTPTTTPPTTTPPTKGTTPR